jgi:hypothetical protein
MIYIMTEDEHCEHGYDITGEQIEEELQNAEMEMSGDYE